jgi:hypothetical protein
MRHWSSPRFWSNLIISHLCSASLHHQGTRWLGGIAHPRHLVGWLWRLKFCTLALSPTSRRLCNVFLWLGRTTLALSTAFSLAFGFLGSILFSTLRSCSLELCCFRFPSVPADTLCVLGSNALGRAAERDYGGESHTTVVQPTTTNNLWTHIPRCDACYTDTQAQTEINS